MDSTVFPKVSVIIPVCNVEKYLPRCLDSIVNQTLTDIEIICVNAGSDDESGSVLDAYREKDGRIIVIHEKRMDAGAARNIGLKIAKGEYLSILDSDDFFHPQMLEMCYNKAKADGADIVVCRAQEFDMKSGRTKKLPSSLRIDMCPQNLTFHPEEMAKYLFNAFQNWAWNKFFRRRFIVENDIWFQSVRRTNDMAFTCHALAAAGKISVLQQTFANYRTGTGTSLQQTNDVAPTSFWDAYMETKHRLEKIGLYETYKQSLQNTVLSGLVYNLNSVKTVQAKQDIMQIIQTQAEKEFALSENSRGYYYNPLSYNTYIKILDGEYTPAPNTGQKTPKDILKTTAKALLDSETYRSLRRFLIQKGILKY